MDQLLNKKEIEVLNYILKEIQGKSELFVEELEPLKSERLDEKGFNVLDYDYYLNRLESFEEYFKVIRRNNYIYLIESTPNTDHFWEQGGFTRLYNLQQIEILRKQKIEEIEYDKLQWDSKVSEFQSKTKWWPLIISVISLVVALISIFK